MNLPPVPQTIVLSHPNSGRNWLAYVLGTYFQEERITHDIKFTHDILNPPLDDLLRWHDIVPVSKETIREYGKVATYDKARLIVLIRDPRDVMVSYFYQKTVREPELIRNGSLSGPPPTAPGAIGEFITSPVYGIRTLVAFMNLWVNRIKSGAHLVTYEQMTYDTLQTVAKTLRYMGLKENMQSVANACEANSFTKLRNSEKKHPHAANANAMKFRSGKAGAYTEHLNRSQVEYIKAEMKKLHGIYRNIYG